MPVGMSERRGANSLMASIFLNGQPRTISLISEQGMGVQGPIERTWLIVAMRPSSKACPFKRSCKASDRPARPSELEGTE